MIKNKQEFYKLYEEGVFGNRWPCWKSLLHFVESGYDKNVSFRYKGTGSGGFVKYDMEPLIVPYEYCNLILEGYSPNDIHITGQDFSENLTRLLQGEVAMLDGKLYLLFSQVNKVMREALKEKSITVEEYLAADVLKKYMDRDSLKNLQRLLKEYPNHVIEFTTYNKPVGVLNLNTVYWEIRYY